MGRIRASIHYVGEQQVVGTVKPQGAGSRRVAGAKTFGSPPMDWPCSCGALGPIKKQVAPKGSALTFWVGVYLAFRQHLGST